ncbi:hypothetical protein G6F68_016592 [Rhizopus microsporus]|nr:hypothetical protein G6F68_016592 [Rhizopus microsporus]
MHRAAAGDALTKARPIVDDLDARAVAAHDGQALGAVVIHRCRGNPLGVERASAIELAAVDAPSALGVGGKAGAAFGGRARAGLGQRVAEAFSRHNGFAEFGPANRRRPRLSP